MIETESAYISKLDEDTVKVVFKPDAFLKKEEYMQMYEHYATVLGHDGYMKFLVIIQEGFNMEEKYMKFFKKDYRIDFKKAEAFIILNPASRMFFKVGIHIINDRYPAQLFTKESEALKWLNKID